MTFLFSTISNTSLSISKTLLLTIVIAMGKKTLCLNSHVNVQVDRLYFFFDKIGQAICFYFPPTFLKDRYSLSKLANCSLKGASSSRWSCDIVAIGKTNVNFTSKYIIE